MKDAYDLPMEIEKYEIVILSKVAVDSSFAIVKNNQSALRKLGWNPYNRSLLDDPDILATASIEYQNERNKILQARAARLDPSLAAQEAAISSATSASAALASASARATGLASLPAPPEVNLTEGYSQQVFDMVIGHHDLQAARNRNAERRRQGTEMVQRLEDAKRVTAGAVFFSGQCRLGLNVLEEVERRKAEKEATASERATRKKQKNVELRDAVERIRRDNRDTKTEIGLIAIPEQRLAEACHVEEAEGG